MLVYNFTKGISASINSASASANYDIIETNGTTASQSISNVLFTAIGTKFSTSTYNSGTFGTYEDVKVSGKYIGFTTCCIL